MKQFVPIEPSIMADEIMTLSVVTTATFADGTPVVVPNTALVGDYAIQAADGTITIDAKADFESRFKPA